jgi:23S rRNA pseudouridine1911/1915/1917 synthase
VRKCNGEAWVMDLEVRRHVVDRGDARRRIDHVLVDRLPHHPALSRARVQAWIRTGRVTVDGSPVTRPSQRLAEGQRVEVALAVAPRRVHPPQPMPLNVVYEDEVLLVIDKPAGLVVHPTRRHPDGTLVNALLWHLRTEGGAPAVPRLIHRLDRQTSGLLLVAKQRETHAAVARAMARRAVEKTYLALVYGAPRSIRDRIDLGVRRDPATGRVVASKAAGLPASTIVELVAASEGLHAGLSLLRCTLVTGRLHQIRVHLSAAGLPIVGDPLYGAPAWRGLRDPALASACASFGRQALHAWRVRLVHPTTGDPLTLMAPVPADLSSLLAQAALPV